jgi:hypothetical protein
MVPLLMMDITDLARLPPCLVKRGEPLSLQIESLASDLQGYVGPRSGLDHQPWIEPGILELAAAPVRPTKGGLDWGAYLRRQTIDPDAALLEQGLSAPAFPMPRVHRVQ